MVYTVGVSQMRVSANPDDVLVTHSLGSCVGLTLYDPAVCVGGMIHCMLPASNIAPAGANVNSYMFADTGVPCLIQAVLDLGARKERIIAKVAGAAKLLNEQATFKIGDRNYIVLQRILWKNKIPIAAEETGGNFSRTMYLYMKDGRTVIRIRGEEKELA